MIVQIVIFIQTFSVNFYISFCAKQEVSSTLIENLDDGGYYIHIGLIAFFGCVLFRPRSSEHSVILSDVRNKFWCLFFNIEMDSFI